MKTIFFTVTNDLTYDQRMHRICSTLAENGYAVTLVGRKQASSLPLTRKSFQQKTLWCWFKKGKLFYSEYNIRLFIFLLFKKADAVCAIDLDTIIPCYWISKLKKVKRVYDAHELFTEQKEVMTRPGVYKLWKKIEAKFVPRFQHGYTVCDSIANELHNRYQVTYQTIRNLPVLQDIVSPVKNERFILYQGAVNEARGFEFLVPAMKAIDMPLIICGDGNYMQQLKALIKLHNAENKVILKGMLTPDELSEITNTAYIGLNLVENTGLNQYFSLANKFFDYIQAGVPQITMNFPEYKKINDQYAIAILIDEVETKKISDAINNLVSDKKLYDTLHKNCMIAKKELNWQIEQKTLLTFYQELFT